MLKFKEVVKMFKGSKVYIERNAKKGYDLTCWFGNEKITVNTLDEAVHFLAIAKGDELKHRTIKELSQFINAFNVERAESLYSKNQIKNRLDGASTKDHWLKVQPKFKALFC